MDILRADDPSVSDETFCNLEIEVLLWEFHSIQLLSAAVFLFFDKCTQRGIFKWKILLLSWQEQDRWLRCSNIFAYLNILQFTICN